MLSLTTQPKPTQPSVEEMNIVLHRIEFNNHSNAMRSERHLSLVCVSASL